MRGPILFTLSALLVGLASANYPLPVLKTCVKESKVKALDLAILYGNDLVTPTQPAKCYLTCVFNSIGIIADGKINTQVLTLPNDHSSSDIFFHKILQSCKDIESSEECEIGHLLYKCLRNEGRSSVLQARPVEADSE